MALTILENELLAPHTTLQVGGVAEYLVTVETEEDLVSAFAFAKERNIKTHVLGGGSNVLISDGGLKGLVIVLRMKGVHHEPRDESVLLTVKAGEVFDDVIAFSVERGWWGLENLSHIPGSVGATPVQNVGAYGVEIKDLLHSVKVFNFESETFEILTNEQCAFGYRDSLFKKEDARKFVVTEVTYVLSVVSNPRLTYRDLAEYFSENKKPSLSEIRKAVILIRSEKFPNWKKVGTAGSFFKNPIIKNEEYEVLKKKYPELPGYETENDCIKIPLGWVLDKIIEVKGVRIGNVGTYEKQALVLINHGGATADQIENFANDIVAEIKNKIDINVEWEVTKIF